MKLTPLYSAVLAVAYICLVVLVIHSLNVVLPNAGEILAPIIMLSLLVLSVAVMATLFFYRPVLLLLEHKAPEALRHLLQTIGIFVGIVFVLVLVLGVIVMR